MPPARPLDLVRVSLSTEIMGEHDDDLPFRIELWDDGDRHVEELIALTADFTTAQATYNDAVKRRPGNASAEGARHQEESLDAMRPLRATAD